MSPVDDDDGGEGDDSSEGPPSLPPRLSPIKTAQPPPPPNGAVDATVRSKSVVDVGSPARKPAIPSRATKPTLSTNER